MNKYSRENVNDWFINLYEQWIFIKCYEYSAIIIWEITWYKVYPNIDKKTWFIFLELWYPQNKGNLIIKELENKWYMIRVFDKNWNVEETIWVKKFEKNIENLIKLKKQLIKFT